MKYKKGMFLKTKKGLTFEILEYKNFKEIKIKFIDTKNIKIVDSKKINSLIIKDELEKTFLNIGFIGIGSFNSKKNKKAYYAWSNMLKRCYDEKNIKYKSYGQKGVYVCDEWHNFQNFAKWFEENYIEGFELDKDTLTNLKFYSPSTCIFLNKKDNLEDNLKKKRKKIISINLNTKEKIIFDSFTECSKKLNIFRSNILKVLKKERKHTKNFTFELVEEKICQTESE